MIYIACPYSHENTAVREHRYRMSCIAASKLFQAGIVAFNPLANSVPAVEFGGIDLAHSEWMSIDIPILLRSDEVLILGLDEWTQSKGVRMELCKALSNAKPITLIDETDIEFLPKIRRSANHFLKSRIFTEFIEDV